MYPKFSIKVGRLALPLVLAMAAFPACKSKPATHESPSIPDQNTSISSQTKLPEHRVALVVGNSSYRYVTHLKNPRNDARLIAKSLKSVGFELVDGGPQIDLDKPGFDRAVQDFGNALQGATTALFYYAGHGIEVNGSNYLVPISANPIRESDVDFQMIDVETVLHQMEDGSARLNIVILDACRNDPFEGHKLRAAGGGLGQMQAPDGTLISYAAQPHAVAMDGDGNDSPFSSSLAEAIREPGLDVLHAFNKVGLSVQEETGRQQRPWVSISPLEGEFYFAKAPAPSPVVAAATTPAVAPPAFAGFDPDVVYWMSVSNSNNPDFLKSYLEQFPRGRFAGLARLKLKSQQETPQSGGMAATPPANAIASAAPPQTSDSFTASTTAEMERASAEQVSHQLTQLGYNPHLLRTGIGEQSRYRIRLGPFATEAQAGAAQKTLDQIETGSQVAMLSPIPLHPLAAEPRTTSISPPPPSVPNAITVRSDKLMDYNKAVAALMSVAQLGYHPHLVPATVNGQQLYRVEVEHLDEQQARNVKNTLRQIAMKSPPTESIHQDQAGLAAPLSITPARTSENGAPAGRRSGPYRINIGETSDHERAEMISQRLRRLGYAPDLIATRQGGQDSYHLEIGGFASEDDAENAVDELNHKYNDAVLAEYSPADRNVAAKHAETPEVVASTGRAIEKPLPTFVKPTPSLGTKVNHNDKGSGIEFSSEPERAGELNPNSYASASYYNRGNAFLLANKLDDASLQFRKAVELNPDNADAYYAWGLTLYMKRDLNEAVDDFRTATRLKPNYPDAYYNWGLALYDLGDPNQAISKFAKAAELRPGYAKAYYNWGLALSRTGHPDDAIEQFQHATELNPGYADAYYGRGVALYNLHRINESVAEYRKALELRPEDESYKRALASALALQQNPGVTPSSK